MRICYCKHFGSKVSCTVDCYEIFAVVNIRNITTIVQVHVKRVVGFVKNMPL